MKIAVFLAKENFSASDQKQLAKLGQVSYTKDRKALSLNQLLAHAKNADIIVADPDNFGGFEKAKPLLTKVIKTTPKLQAVCLASTSFGWIDLGYCQKRNILVSNVPGYSRESVAEHAIALLLCQAKNFF